MRFGIFDHIDAGNVPPAQQFEERLRLAEAYDRLGFYAYQIAEHHGTPLGLAPSPGVFVAAAAQRTRRLRLGPLVYSLPLYHPVRLIEEICMLDHLSSGRFELGVGRGVSPIEVGFYGVNPADGSRQFPEALRVIKHGLTSDELTFDGEFYRFDRVPMVLKPLQKPHPPLWYGVVAAETAHWAALEEAHMVTLVPTEPARAVIARYETEWAALGRARVRLPMRGVMRLIVLAATEGEAFATAERAYRRWLGHMRFLWDRHGMAFPLNLPPEIKTMHDVGAAFVGTPKGFVRFVREQVQGIGADYLACDVAFGDMSYAEALRTAELVGSVIPEFE